MDRAKYQAFVDDLNELVKKHGLVLYSGLAYYELELASTVGEGDVTKVRVDDETNKYRIDEGN